MTTLLGVVILLSLLPTAASAQPAVGCDEARRLYRQGVRARDYTQKTNLYRMAVRKCPSYAEAYTNLGDALEKLGRLEEAERSYGEASRLKPGLAVARFGRGDVLLKLGRYAEAVASYQNGLRLDPGDRLAREGLAKARAALPPGHPLRTIRSKEIRDHFVRVKTMGPGGTRLGGLAFPNILFEFNSSKLKAESLDQVGQIGNALVQLVRDRGMRFRVEGHTDSKGPDAYNLKLSQLRANAVVRFLTERHGVPHSNLRAIGVGESQPMASNETDEGRRLNRRVEVALDE